MSQDIQALAKRAFAVQQGLMQVNQAIAVDLASHQAANATDMTTLISWGGPSLKLQSRAMEAGTLAATFTGLAMAYQTWAFSQKIPNAPSLPEPAASPTQILQLERLEGLVKLLSSATTLDERRTMIEAG
jgi:hypothetical protein